MDNDEYMYDRNAWWSEAERRGYKVVNMPRSSYSLLALDASGIRAGEFIAPQDRPDGPKGSFDDDMFREVKESFERLNKIR